MPPRLAKRHNKTSAMPCRRRHAADFSRSAGQMPRTSAPPRRAQTRRDAVPSAPLHRYRRCHYAPVGCCIISAERRGKEGEGAGCLHTRSAAFMRAVLAAVITPSRRRRTVFFYHGFIGLSSREAGARRRRSSQNEEEAVFAAPPSLRQRAAILRLPPRRAFPTASMLICRLLHSKIAAIFLLER